MEVPLTKTRKATKEEFYEYRDDFLEVLELDDVAYDNARTAVRKFWPKNGPQWDGLALVTGSDGEKGLLLVEAKAHLDEIKADVKAKSQISIEKLNSSIGIAQKIYGIKPVDWTKNYYQLGNRIAFLYFMNEVLKIPTWLVLINFTDGIYKTTRIEDWLAFYHDIYVAMGIKHDNCKLISNVIQIFPKTL